MNQNSEVITLSEEEIKWLLMRRKAESENIKILIKKIKAELKFQADNGCEDINIVLVSIKQAKETLAELEQITEVEDVDL